MWIHIHFHWLCSSFLIQTCLCKAPEKGVDGSIIWCCLRQHLERYSPTIPTRNTGNKSALFLLRITHNKKRRSYIRYSKACAYVRFYLNTAAGRYVYMRQKLRIVIHSSVARTQYCEEHCLMCCVKNMSYTCVWHERWYMYLMVF